MSATEKSFRATAASNDHKHQRFFKLVIVKSTVILKQIIITFTDLIEHRNNQFTIGRYNFVDRSVFKAISVSYAFFENLVTVFVVRI